MPIVAPNSGENVTRMPTTYQIGTPTSDHAQVFRSRRRRREQRQEIASRHASSRLHALEHAGLRDADAQDEQRDAHRRRRRNTRSASRTRRRPATRPRRRECRPWRRSSCRNRGVRRHDLADERDAGPSSPARPMPATKRSTAYCGTVSTKPFAMLASEYMTIDPNSTDSRPRLSPRMPQSMPPTSMPPICMLSRRTPWLRIWSAGTPSDLEARDADDAEEDEVVDVDEIARARRRGWQARLPRGRAGTARTRRWRRHQQGFYCAVSSPADVPCYSGGAFPQPALVPITV